MKSAKRIPLIPPFTLSLSKGAGGGGPPRGQGVDLLFWAFHPPPMPPPKGDITGGTLLIFFWIPASPVHPEPVEGLEGVARLAGRGWTLLSWLYILHLRPLRRGRLLAVCCSLFSGYRPPDFARAGMTTLSVTQGLAKFSGGYKNHVININAKRSEALGGSERLISK